MAKKHVTEILDKLNKGKNDFGEITTYGSKITKVSAVSTGITSLDIATGIGGYPKGGIIEVFGPESSGKTTLTLQAVAAAQQRGIVAAFVDAEHVLDMNYARALGVNPNEMIFNQPSSGEKALELVVRLAESMENGGLIIIDSVAGLTPQSELDGEVGDQHIGAQARLMGQALRKTAGILNKNKVTAIFVNQIRQKIGITFGSNVTTPGGNALKFYASMRIEIKRIGGLTKNNVKYGQRARLTIVKNKLASPFKTIETDIIYGYGIPKYNDVIDLAVDAGIVEKNSSWYSFENNKIGNGKEQTITALSTMPEVFSKIEAGVMKHHGFNTN